MTIRGMWSHPVASVILTALSVPTGEKNRRTRTKTVMRGACGRWVISLATAMSSVPTGVNSPDRRLTDNGYFCNQYGYIAYDDYGVQYSYGKSPDINRNEGARYIYRDGDSFSGSDYNIRDSYGTLVRQTIPKILYFCG